MCKVPPQSAVNLNSHNFMLLLWNSRKLDAHEKLVFYSISEHCASWSCIQPVNQLI